MFNIIEWFNYMQLFSWTILFSIFIKSLVIIAIVNYILSISHCSDDKLESFVKPILNKFIAKRKSYLS